MKSYLVTGAGNGIGCAIVIALGEPDDTAVLNDLTYCYELNRWFRSLRKEV